MSKTASLQERRALLELAERTIRLRMARESVTEMLKLAMPDEVARAAGQKDATRYHPAAFHNYLAEHLHRMEKLYATPVRKRPKKSRPYLALSVPPQHGKTQLASVGFCAWFWGRNPHAHILFATYNQDQADSIGRQVRAILQQDWFQEVFPDFALDPANKSASSLTSTHSGRLFFMGRGGSGTGRAADLVIIDDPIKNREEARSDTIIKGLWEWYNDVMDARMHAGTIQLIIHTRWVVDDLIGRLVDPVHPDHDPMLAKYWNYVNFPAVNFDPDLADHLGQELRVCEDPLALEVFGNRPSAALWEERFPVDFMARKAKRSKQTFQALHQGNPTPDDGVFFRREMLMTYEPHELPPKHELAIYGASDHAISEKREDDPSAIGCVGVDKSDNIWVLPDIMWMKMDPDSLVEAIVEQILNNKPINWFAENDLIAKALGPSLRRRMEERRAYCMITPMSTANDKRVKASAIQARMSLKKVRFPKFATWWPDAERQLLKFPLDKNDDFVDLMGLFGRGLDSIIGASSPKTVYTPRPGSFAHFKQRAKEVEKARNSMTLRHSASY